MEALNLDFSPILLVLVFKKARGHFDDTMFQEFVMMIKNAFSRDDSNPNLIRFTCLMLLMVYCFEPFY